MTKLEDYYNKFFEEKRLNSRHGQVEYQVTMHYIEKYLKKLNLEKEEIQIADIGAGTGRYAVPLSEEGYQVTAVELVQHNLGVLKAKGSKVTAMKGNAMNLKKLPSNHYDLVLLLGPLYHLFSFEDKCKALSEAKRIVKENGTIFVAYVMNEYGLITYGFKERHILEVKENQRLTKDFKCLSREEDLYDYVRVEEINALREAVDLERLELISPDGPANYMRPFLNQLSEEEFRIFVEYQKAVAPRQDLIGAAAHTVDILRKKANSLDTKEGKCV